MSWLWWAPLGAAALHIVEEFFYPGGFAAWDREYRPDISASITPGLHVVVNTLLLIACALVGMSGMGNGTAVVGGVRLRSAIPAGLSVASWLALAALLFSNALWHLVGSFQTKRISPGVRTGMLLYVPLALAGYWYFLRTGQVSLVVAGFAALVGGSYHLWSTLGHRWRSQRSEV